jgi:hypothetical protein
MHLMAFARVKYETISYKPLLTPDFVVDILFQSRNAFSVLVKNENESGEGGKNQRKNSFERYRSLLSFSL